MTLEELITAYRAQSGDKVQPFFCDDELLALYASEAQDEACRRGRLLRDASSSLCSVAYRAGDESVALNDRVLQVIRASTNGRPMGLTSLDEMDESHPNWQDAGATGAPRVLVSAVTTGRLHLWPIPIEDGILRLTVYRLPLKGLTGESDKPEIRPELHRALVEWMLYRAYSRVDSDQYDSRASAVALANFEAEFGSKASGRNEQWVRNGAAVGPAPIA